MATESDQRSLDPLGVHIHNRKLRNIRPSGAFWPEVTLWNVTRSDRRSPELVPLCVCISALVGNRNYSAILATLQITSYVHSRNSS